LGSKPISAWFGSIWVHPCETIVILYGHFFRSDNVTSTRRAFSDSKLLESDPTHISIRVIVNSRPTDFAKGGRKPFLRTGLGAPACLLTGSFADKRVTDLSRLLISYDFGLSPKWPTRENERCFRHNVLLIYAFYHF